MRVVDELALPFKEDLSIRDAVRTNNAPYIPIGSLQMLIRIHSSTDGNHAVLWADWDVASFELDATRNRAGDKMSKNFAIFVHNLPPLRPADAEGPQQHLQGHLKSV